MSIVPQNLDAANSELLAEAPRGNEAASTSDGSTDARRPAGFPFEIKLLTSAELADGPYDVEWLVEDILVRDQPMVIAGPPKILKTSIAVSLGMAVAIGRPFLGRFNVSQAERVLIMSGESGLSTLQSTGARIAASYGLELRDFTGLIWSKNLIRLDQERHLSRLYETLKGSEIGMLILDPLYLMLPGADAGNLMAMGTCLRGLSQLCEDLGVTVVVIHHTKRAAGGKNNIAPPSLLDISWAGTAEWARQWILLDRPKPFMPGSGEHRLRMVTGGSAGHSGGYNLLVREGTEDNRIWDVTVGDRRHQGEPANADGDGQLGNKAQSAILNALNNYPQGETVNKIRDDAGLSGKTAALAFEALVRASKIEPCEIIRRPRKTPYPGYKLTAGAKHHQDTQPSAPVALSDSIDHQSDNPL